MSCYEQLHKSTQVIRLYDKLKYEKKKHILYRKVTTHKQIFERGTTIRQIHAYQYTKVKCPTIFFFPLLFIKTALKIMQIFFLFNTKLLKHKSVILTNFFTLHVFLTPSFLFTGLI